MASLVPPSTAMQLPRSVSEGCPARRSPWLGAAVDGPLNRRASAPPSPLRSPARLLAIPDEGAEIAAHSIGDLLGADVPPIHDPRLTGCIWRDRCSAVPGCQASPRSAMHLGVTPQIDACTGRRA
eukprot:GGOE01020329.1.p2 GENE.GGOE01020329.1~~GGOE01020329.1.p2  ORF type:complete len:125 (+),score=7.93 GGOE01020329.1:61-435(+)